MSKFIKKSAIIEATQWFEKGDDPKVEYFRHPNIKGLNYCLWIIQGTAFDHPEIVEGK